MPLLLCPNCNTSMSAVSRQAVEFDMCPSCRGVWLDRGELEKLIAAGRGEAPAQESAAPRMWREPERPRRDYDDDDDDHRHPGYRRKKRFDLFDIFD
ncbi:MAG: zf-TFIIB domain-containing protein [Phenylobacterium sp.]|jgi:Zn-finger nucleic acid-binding protein|uniref:Zf-TFIIB domain-containing protein n=1 Tax=Phenylobacterium ferrooxidans TaxID=2982689 RepID=A0ABW6CTS9_9CAUL|nr:zf-TFIIB domain-containing protein [Phenylobacterium sp.]MDO8321569.1 zf-TFIIB domain-containing protein [Phenylobacterium sp.]MDO8912539.1 zf-TFIIB domain-containing protein [Phenylobacterium sp.]MDO9247529.1 zf-TFIIB domain-containing protein [Phenylobacterium sp.]MDP2008843.1 zf-TFIIB domain-containing protein [Phenylobacterium sp.]MDP3101122.1 zf-TFIIB domain-containing protein [Phenylobacterium sp.]